MSDPFSGIHPLDRGGYVLAFKLGTHEFLLVHRRNNYTSYNETPTKKGKLVNPKTAKAALKITLMIVSMVAYGAIHKADKKLNEKIDEHFEPEAQSETPQDN